MTGMAAAPAAAPGLLPVEGWRALVVAVSKDPNAKMTALLFGPGAADPERAIKVPSTALAADALAAEAAALHELHRLGLGGVAATVPLPLGTRPTPWGAALLMSGLRGTPMTTAYHRWRHTSRPGAVTADLGAALAWLERFWRATARGSGILDPVAPLMPTLESRFGGDPRWEPARHLLGGVRERTRETRTPLTAVHGDFWFGNVLLERGEVSGVLDWELASSSGLPTRDLVRFALAYALYLDRHTRAGRPVRGHRGLRAGPFGSGIAHALDGRGWFPQAARDFLGSGLGVLGIPVEHWRDLALAGIAEVAASADHPDFASSHLDLLLRLGEER